jgi:DNA-binding transcriptional LysR family regulator
MDLEPDLLRTFVAFAESGSLARAAAAVGRTPSAVTAQVKRLEDAVGSPLLAPAGRGRVLTDTGLELLSIAREILDTQRRALLRLKGQRNAGKVSLAATQDFAESGLPPLLRLFASTHPRVKLEVRIGRTIEINEALAAGQVDVAIVMRSEPSPLEIGLVPEPTIWLAATDGLSIPPSDELPLALLDPPCGFRTAALAGLDKAGRTYRVAATSQSLAGLRAAVLAGFAVTLRTARWLGPGVSPAPAFLHLPQTDPVTFSIRLNADATAPARDLAELLAAELPSGGR